MGKFCTCTTRRKLALSTDFFKSTCRTSCVTNRVEDRSIHLCMKKKKNSKKVNSEVILAIRESSVWHACQPWRSVGSIRCSFSRFLCSKLFYITRPEKLNLFYFTLRAFVYICAGGLIIQKFHFESFQKNELSAALQRLLVVLCALLTREQTRPDVRGRLLLHSSAPL